jgi:hypothetical protein
LGVLGCVFVGGGGSISFDYPFPPPGRNFLFGFITATMAMMMSVGASQTVSAAQVCFPRTPTKQLMSFVVVRSCDVLWTTQIFASWKWNCLLLLRQEYEFPPELVLYSWELVRTCIHQF